MAEINIEAGLAIKADLNKLLSDVAGSIARFSKNRQYGEEEYKELLEEYARLVGEVENIRNQLNDLLDEAHSNKLPDDNEINAIDAMAGLMGAKNQDGSLDIQKLMELGESLGDDEGAK